MLYRPSIIFNWFLISLLAYRNKIVISLVLALIDDTNLNFKCLLDPQGVWYQTCKLNLPTMSTPAGKFKLQTECCPRMCWILQSSCRIALCSLLLIEFYFLQLAAPSGKTHQQGKQAMLLVYKYKLDFREIRDNK